MSKKDDMLFDDMMREKMSSFNTNETGDWAFFESKLVSGAGLPSDENFDKEVSEAMQDYSVASNAADWDVFEKQLEATEKAAINEFDDGLRAHFNNYSTSYNENHWASFEFWLNHYQMTKSYLFAHKSAEAVIVILLLFTWSNFSTLLFPKKTTPNPIAVYVGGNLTEKLDTSTNEIITYNHATIKEEQKEFSVKNNLAEVNNKTRITGSKVKSTSDFKFMKKEKFQKLNSLIGTARDQINNSTGSSNQLLASSQTLNQSKLDKTQVISAQDLEKSSVGNVINKQESELIDIAFTAAETIDQTSSLLINDLSLSAPVVNLIELNDSKKKKNLYLKPVVGLEWNRVKTPFDQVYNHKGYNQDIIGSSAGLLVGKDFGSLSVETGLLYSSKTYEPKRILEIFKNSDNEEQKGVSLDQIGYNIVTLPINLNYRFSSRKKWSPYLTFGAAMHVALQAYYEKTETPINELGITALSSARYTNGTKPKLEEKRFNDGLFENGKFKNNYYFTFNLGGGVERTFSDRLSMFIQPTLSFNLFNKGLGPNNDKIHNVSILTGVKYRFGSSKKG